MASKWYLASVLLAKERKPHGRVVACETCDVIIHAANALAAQRKAMRWLERYAKTSTLRPVGVTALTSIEEAPGDGIEVAGRFFESRKAWKGLRESIPSPEALAAVRWEGHKQKRLSSSLTARQQAILRSLGEK